ncbi:hypothetical protein BKA58DRAFT_462694 [Alternaria rosae]|uniref:uncharacterized protein n=1 Tax=Alternaria rosae TaxID=1187941 RepID=UPI001E8ED2B8|nr:uncharacterized protein BKA58DRAFT_462694 [Alternaria rosae]KAH6865106.1 hypothetical protein BKA58DRAFT_462694 [Alternaria rosae]
MATPTPFPTSKHFNLTTTQEENAIETDLALPGIKRGIAIGVACSVSVVVIAILAFFAIRRRNRVLARRAQLQTTKRESMDAEAGPQEKAWYSTPASSPPLPTPPPVEADVRTIYELDAGQIPELHGDTAVQEVEGNGNIHATSEAEELYVRKLEQWRTWSIALEPDTTSHTIEAAHAPIPLLMVSPPEASPGGVSPLQRLSRDYPAHDGSPVSPPPNVHFPSVHREYTNH